MTMCVSICMYVCVDVCVWADSLSVPGSKKGSVGRSGECEKKGGDDDEVCSYASII